MVTSLWPSAAEALGACGIEIPPWRVASSLAEADAAVTALGAPLITRPLTPQGEYCAFIADHPADAELAFLRARMQSADGHALFQPRMPGQVFLASAMRGADSTEDYAPISVSFLQQHVLTPVEFVCPPRLDAATEARIRQATLSVATRLQEGPKVVVCEFSCHAPSLSLLHAYAVDVLAPPLAMLLGLQAAHGAACIHFLHPPAGVVKRVDGVEAALSMPGLVELTVTAKPGAILRHLNSIAARDGGGYVATVGESPAEAQNRARAALGCIQVSTAILDHESFTDTGA